MWIIVIGRFRDYLPADFPTKNAEHVCGLVAV